MAVDLRTKFPSEEETVSEDKLALFSHWYFDGVEDFDCWVRDRLSAVDQSKKSLLAILYGDIQQKILHDTSIGEDVLRLFIWLGDDLLPILDDIMASSRIEKKELQYVARFTQSFQVKQKLKDFDK